MAFRETVGSLFRCFVRRDSSSSDEAKQTKTILLRDDDEAVEAAVRAKRIPSHDGGQERDLVLHIGPDQGCAPKKDADPTSSPSSPSSNQQYERHDSAPTTSNSNNSNSNSNSNNNSNSNSNSNSNNTHTSNKTANAWEQQRPALTTLRTSATMSVRKSKAVAAAVALKARKDLANKRRKAYTKALGSLRMGFIDGDGFDRERERECECECETDAKGGSFWRGEDWFEWLDEEEREREREHRRTRNQWQHTFLNYWDEDDSPNRKKKKKKKKTMASQFSALSDPASSNTNTNTNTNALPPTHSINVRVLHREYVNYASNLPVTPEGSIFVRVPENRLDLPRVLITGPHDTPYSNGLFFFDCFLKDYPDTPPMVRFLTTGNGKVRFNPNLYNCGEVCLSLLGTWQGPGWNPGSSTLLQVLVSCQGLILGTEEPFYNEPGYEIYKGTKECRKESNRYNTELRKQTLKWGILDPLKKIVLQEERIEERRLALEELRKLRSRPPRSREDVDANETRHQREDGDYDQQEQQQQQQLDNESSSVPGSNGRDGCTAGHKPILATKTQASNNANASNSSTQANANATAKSKPWSTVLPWSFSSKPSPSTEFAAHPSAKATTTTTTTTTTTSTTTTTTTTSSNPGLLPRCDCDYPEFTTIAIRHFVETADHLEEQLKSWTQLDPSRATKQHAEEIRVWLKRLLDLVEARSQRRRGTTKDNTPLEQQQQQQQQQRRAPDQVATATATRAGNA